MLTVLNQILHVLRDELSAHGVLSSGPLLCDVRLTIWQLPVFPF